MRLRQIIRNLDKNPFEKALDSFCNDAGKAKQEFLGISGFLPQSRLYAQVQNAHATASFLAQSLEDRREAKRRVLNTPDGNTYTMIETGNPGIVRRHIAQPEEATVGDKLAIKSNTRNIAGWETDLRPSSDLAIPMRPEYPSD